jgi:hypothetical protein
MQPPPGALVDHVNGDTLDNRRENLRVATHAENSQNKRKISKGFKGVYERRGHWIASIAACGTRVRLGSFATPEEAAMAYDDGARKWHGPFARVNFPRVGEQLA